MTLPTVATLWIGGRLSYLEQLCLASFVAHGHRVLLYAYAPIDNAPAGVEVRDAAAILPAGAPLCHRRSGSPAVQADLFRYRLLAAQPVIWVDADMLCLRPWDLAGPWVFGWEKTDRRVCNAVLGLPPGSRTLARLNAFCADEYPVPPWSKPDERARLEAARDAGRPVHVSDLPWGVWGPAAVTHFLRETGEIALARPQAAFYPVPFRDRRALLAPGQQVEAQLGEDSLGVHLWNRRLRRRLITHEGGVPHADSYLGRALAQHGIDPAAAPIPDVPPPDSPAARRPQGDGARGRCPGIARLPTCR